MPKYKHKYTTFSNVIIALSLLLVNFIQILNPFCYQSGLIGLGFTILVSILELPTIAKTCSVRCTKLYDQLNNKKIYIFKFALYLAISIGMGFIFNIYNNCPLMVFNCILLIFSSFTYLISFILNYRNNNNNNTTNNSKFNAFKSPTAKTLFSGLRAV